MAITFTYPIAQLEDNKYAPVTSGNYYLRVDPFSSNTYTGSHLGDGIWNFGTVEDGIYQMWDASAQVTKFGERWIGDDSLGKYTLTSTFVSTTGNLNSSITGLESATGTLSTAVTSLESATGELNSTLSSLVAITSNNNSWTGTNRYTARTYFDNGFSLSGGYAHFYNYTNFHSYVPYVDSDPSHANHLTKKSWVEAKINAITNGLSATYQQSQNIVRCVPNGTQEENRLYTTIALCNSFARNYATTAHQYCIQVEGEGNTTNIIALPVHNPAVSDYVFVDNVHLRGQSSDIWLQTNISETVSISASELGKIIWENLNLFGEGDGTQNFQNIIFKNCKFYASKVGDPSYYYSFTNCVFEGGNYFKGNSPSFASCSGERVFSEEVPNVSGDTMLQYYTPTQFVIGSHIIKESSDDLQIFSTEDVFIQSTKISLSGQGTNAPNTASGTISEYFGDVGNEKALAEPHAWVTVYFNGTRYACPLYAL